MVRDNRDAASERAAEEEGGGGHGDQGEDGEEGEVGSDGPEAGVFEQQFLEAVHGVGEGVDDGDDLHPGGKGVDGDRPRRWGRTGRC